MKLLDRIAYDTGGYTVQEILSSFCKKILEIIDLVNKNEEVCDETRTIIENIRNEVVPHLVDDIIEEMEGNGYFDSLVNVTLIENLRTELTTLLNEAITDYTTGLDNIDSQLDNIAINVKKFGAKGDGITDDTDSIQRCIDESGEGACIFIPSGVYLTNRLYLKRGQTLYGNGRSTVLKFKGQHVNSPSGFGGVINGIGSSSNPISGITIRDLSVNGNKGEITTPNQTAMDDVDIECINIKYGKNCTVSNIYVYDAKDSGVDLDGCIDCTVTNITGNNCGGYCVHISEHSENNNVNSCYAYKCGIDHSRGGFDSYLNTKNNKYNNCHCEECNIGFNIKGESISIVNCSDKKSIQNSIRLEGKYNKVNNYYSEDATNNVISIPSDDNELTNIFITGTNASFYIDGNNNSLSNCKVKDNSYGYRINGINNTLINCSSENSYNSSFEVNGNRNKLIGCSSYNPNTNAIVIKGDSQTISGFTGTGTKTDSCIIIESENNIISGGTINNNVKSGIWVKAASYNVITNVEISQNGTNGIYLDGGNNQLIGNIFSNNTSDNVKDTGSTNKYISNIGLANN